MLKFWFLQGMHNKPYIDQRSTKTDLEKLVKKGSELEQLKLKNRKYFLKIDQTLYIYNDNNNNTKDF